jgi:ABC-2 type transport system ATP-binding protein
MTPAILVENLTKRYAQADTNAVDGISFVVEPGVFFALLGPNGAGKTTTISILTTTLSPTSGTVQVAGYDIQREASAVRQQIGINFQAPSLDMNLTAEENIRFHAILYKLYPFRPTYGLMPQAYKKQVGEMASVLGLDGEMGKPVRTFSGGMKRKLEVVRSLIHKPQVLFLDEPTAGLDTEARHSLWSYLKQTRSEEGTTTFLTTHHLEEAESADQVCIIHQGRIAAQGTPDQLKAELAEDYLTLDTDDPDALRRELRALGIPFEETDTFRIRLDGSVPGVHAMLKAIDTPLTLVRTHTPSLEDAYLKIIWKNNGS